MKQVEFENGKTESFDIEDFHFNIRHVLDTKNQVEMILYKVYDASDGQEMSAACTLAQFNMALKALHDTEPMSEEDYEQVLQLLPQIVSVALLFAGFPNMTTLNVYTCKNFNVGWPVGAAAVVVAKHPVQARAELYNQLCRTGLEPTREDAAKWIFELVPLDKANAVVLNVGHYG